jgi:hypothetical protein
MAFRDCSPHAALRNQENSVDAMTVLPLVAFASHAMFNGYARHDAWIVRAHAGGAVHGGVRSRDELGVSKPIRCRGP